MAKRYGRRRRKLKMTKTAVAARRRYRANKRRVGKTYKKARRAAPRKRKHVDRKRLGWGHVVRVRKRREARQTGLKLGPPWPKNRQPPHCTVCGLHAKYEGTSPSGRVYFLCGKHRRSGNLTNRRRAPTFGRKTRKVRRRVSGYKPKHSPGSFW